MTTSLVVKASSVLVIDGLEEVDCCTGDVSEHRGSFWLTHRQASSIRNSLQI